MIYLTAIIAAIATANAGPTPPVGDFILAENGDYLIAENGDFLVLE